MSWFRKKVSEVLVPYIPQGRIGYKQFDVDNHTYQCTVIIEEIAVIGIKSKMKILEVSVDRDCLKTKEQCLKRWGPCDWVTTDYINWETEEQKCNRQGVHYMVPESLTKPEKVIYRLTPQPFIRND